MNLPEAEPVRHWLADVLAGRPPDPLPDLAATALKQLITEARQQGVVALVNWRLLSFCSGAPAANEIKQPSSRGRDSHAQRNAGAAPTGLVSSFEVTDATMKLSQAFAAATREAVLWSMLLEAETRHLLAVMAQAGFPGLLLKGQALAQWAYAAPHLRASGDVDVLLSSSKDAELIARQLRQAGYELSHVMPDELVGYELTCARKVSDAVSIEIDLHWRLSNSPLFGYRFTFDELMNESIALPGLAANARGLGPVHALIHACTHRAFNLSEPDYYDSLKWLFDIPMITRGFAANDWDHLIALCHARGLAGVCLVSLDAASETFGAEFLAMPPAVRAALEQARAGESLDVARLRRWRYREYKVMMALPTIGMRLRYLGQRFLPSRDYMARLYQRPDLGYLGLIAIRVRTALRRLLG